jgi:TonB family protein
MFWILLAAQASVPVLNKGDVRQVFSADDVPIELIGEDHFRTVNVRITVGPDGKLRNCEAEFSSGVPKLDAYTCDIIRRRATQFRPAIWTDGTPSYGVIRMPIRWSVGGEPPAGSAADIELTVSDLPNGAKSPVFIFAELTADEKGHPLTCSENGDVRRLSRSKVTPELLRIGCDQLLKNYVAIPARDDAGKPVRSVQEAMVSFSKAKR